ncbi:hypothetical protein ASPZODRAFT_119101 [Penicilliopsis zonata CBS 506.65]|uniref:Rhodopsin domain-containing protein n=1 Tax=Penicilliopsis zonata CBS 506.65 TaxID=1073090 RepID=A0A1L9SFD1_9EURO|nr:hypothetical protein ASPZODRAFT_119101 [Penicilliopsis zonata CBS 506.65]OJJ45858.1 hypothetical protein ASPZODRAFT_119101 [Penicilliopsis zonata CBS 506.65]
MPSQGPTVIGVAVFFAVLTFVVLSLRLFTRIYVFGQVRLDDYLIIVAACLSWSFIAVTIVAVQNGLGRHIDTITAPEMETYLLVVWLSSMFYLACLGFIKSSVLVYYTHLENRMLTRLAYIMLGVISCQAGSFVLVAAFQCGPIHKAWDPTVPGKCVNIDVFYLANAALNITTDLITYMLPMNVILRLHIPNRQKAGILVILCFGLFTCIASIIRITYIPIMLTSPDSTYVISGAMYWSAIETNIGILTASMPSFKAILTHFLPDTLSQSSYVQGSESPSQMDHKSSDDGDEREGNNPHGEEQGYEHGSSQREIQIDGAFEIEGHQMTMELPRIDELHVQLPKTLDSSPIE